MTIEPEQIIMMLGLEPLPQEGGFFSETYRSTVQVSAGMLGSKYPLDRNLSTAIYYLLTPDTFSALHRLPGDEVFHFYLGDPVDMVQFNPNGTVDRYTIGTDLATGMRPQIVVPGGTWQGSRLVSGGRVALMGTTMAPGFDFQDYEHGDRRSLESQYPSETALIRQFTI